MKTVLIALSSLVVPLLAQTNPLETSWYTDASGQYALIYESTADQAAQNAVTTWSSGAGVQDLPTYAGIHQIETSADWVYIYTTGLGAHIMGPWYLDEAKTQLFGNFPSNVAVTWRFPKTPVVPAVKTSLGAGTMGYYVDGVAMFDFTDTFSYDTSAGADSSPVAGAGIVGDGIWVRDAFVNEGVTFDPANAHQAGNNHHYHANPPGLRHLLGDSVDYDAAANAYTENFTGAHSPILGWANDGFPIYGPYGYDDPTDPDSSVRRMISGFTKRDGSFGSIDLTLTGRTSLPAWEQVYQGRGALATTEYGPAVSAAFVLGHYVGDYAYLGDLGYSQGVDFDLDLYNGRLCVTPEYPQGVYAYFVSIEVDGTPKFPYAMCREFYGDPLGDIVTEVTEPVTNLFLGGTQQVFAATAMAQVIAPDEVLIRWDAVQGGDYRVESSFDLTNWVDEVTGVSLSNSSEVILHDPDPTPDRKFYRLAVDGFAEFDDVGYLGGTAAPVGGGGPGGGGGGPGGGGGTGNGAPFTFAQMLPPDAMAFSAATLTGGIPVTVDSVDTTARTISVIIDDALLVSGASYMLSVTFSPPDNTVVTLTSTSSFTAP